MRNKCSYVGGLHLGSFNLVSRADMDRLHEEIGFKVNTSMSQLEMERRSHVDTATAAFYLGRRPQTMRVWASAESGPIRPIRVHGRLAWPVADIRSVLRVAPQ
jgi:hypothetical protein